MTRRASAMRSIVHSLFTSYPTASGRYLV